jgi:hypothetical protein
MFGIRLMHPSHSLLNVRTRNTEGKKYSIEMTGRTKPNDNTSSSRIYPKLISFIIISFIRRCRSLRENSPLLLSSNARRDVVVVHRLFYNLGDRVE